MNEDKKAAIQQVRDLAFDKHTAYRLTWGPIILLMCAAVGGDVFTLIPFVGDAVGPIVWVATALYLYKKGFGLMNPGRLSVELIDMAAKMFPVIQEFPELTIGMALIIVMTRIEDRTGMKANIAGRSTDELRLGNRVVMRQPLNDGGVRLPKKTEPEAEEDLQAA